MSQTCAGVYVHFVWATYRRAGFLTPDLARRVYGCVGAEAERLGCEVLAIGGVSDYTHALFQLPTRVSIARLAKQVKGVSSHVVNERVHLEEHFAWQAGYGVFSVSPWDVGNTARYIARQREHHSRGSIIAQLEDVGSGDDDSEAA